MRASILYVYVMQSFVYKHITKKKKYKNYKYYWFKAVPNSHVKKSNLSWEAFQQLIF